MGHQAEYLPLGRTIVSGLEDPLWFCLGLNQVEDVTELQSAREDEAVITM
jgi:hypothetical protein